MDQQFSLRWNNYLNQLTEAFGSLRYEEDLVDVTLCCEGGKLRAHKMLLSACSPYFRDIFKDNPCQHPVIVFRNTQFSDLQAILDFIYKGEVNVLQENLESFLGTAELLEIKGLTEGNGKDISLEEREEERKNGQETVIEVHREMTSSSPPSLRTYARSKSPPSKKRRYSSRGKASPRNQSEVEVESTETTVEPKIEQEEYDQEIFEVDEDDIKVPLSPTSDPLHIPEDDESSCVNLDPPSISTDEEPPTTIELTDEPMEEEESTSKKETEIEKKTDVEPTVETEKSILEEEKVTIMDVTTDKVTSESLKNTANTKVTKTNKEEKKAETPKKPAKPKPVSKSAPVKMKPALKSKSGIHLPKGLTVTISPVVKELPSEFVKAADGDEVTALRSEEAMTPVQEEPLGYPYQQSDLTGVATVPGMVGAGEPVMAEEAPQVDPTLGEADVPENEEEEPEFDYYGCETCKTEAKQVDRFNFSHKCPICPCACFCAHLLKEHMKVIHGWFNVQRRFTTF